MSETINLFILLGSFAGIIAILYRKISLLRELPSQGGRGGLREFVVGNVKNVVKSERLQTVSPERILHKALSKIRVLAMKTENQTGEWLKELRQRSQERKTKFSESYFEQFKKKAGKGKQE